MFKNRKLVVNVEKVTKNQNPDAPCDSEEFEKKAEIILHKLESLGAKMFLGICIYVILDTRRQVMVTNNIHSHG